MLPGPLSPVMLIAADGLIQNQGLMIGGNLMINVNTYTSTSVVSTYLGIVANAAGVVGNTTITNIQQLAANSLPAVTDAIPGTYYANISNIGNLGNSTSMSAVVVAQADRILGNGDYSIFAQVYGGAQAFAGQNNQYVGTTTNSNLLNPTFTGMNSLSTAGISDTNSNLQLFGTEMAQLGQLWDLTNLDYFGFPSTVLLQLAKSTGLTTELYERLIANGVTQSDLTVLTVPGNTPSTNLNALIYKSFKQITGTALDKVKYALGIRAPGLTTMADLLDPVKTLPLSYRTLTLRVASGTGTVPTDSVLANIYTAANTVNNNLAPIFATNPLYQELKLVIPPDQALANFAIARTLQQIKNVQFLTLPVLATSVTTVETNSDLALINALTQPVPTNVQTSLNSLLATGTGVDGNLTLYDLIGSVTGYVCSDAFNDAAANITAMTTANLLANLISASNGVYTVMANTLAGDYNDPFSPPQVIIPGPLPGAGTYANISDAFDTGLLPAAESIIGNIVTANPTYAANLNTSFDNIAIQISTEALNLAAAQVDFGNIIGNNKSSVFSLATSLHEIGTSIAPQGPNDLFTAIANTATLTGQAVVASLREGRNIAVFDQAGIAYDTQIPLRT